MNDWFDTSMDESSKKKKNTDQGDGAIAHKIFWWFHWFTDFNN